MTVLGVLALALKWVIRMLFGLLVLALAPIALVFVAFSAVCDFLDESLSDVLEWAVSEDEEPDCG